MKKEFKSLHDAMGAILADPRSSRFERILAAQIILSLHGCLLPAIDERWLSVRQITELRRLQQRTVDRVLKKKAARKRQNRRAYLRREIKKLDAAQQAEQHTGEHDQQVN